jgi:hypothetical protein
MFDAQKFKFVKEFRAFRDVLNVDNFTQYQNKLEKLVKHPEYNFIAGLSFEFIIGVLLHQYGDLKQFGVMDYSPTYIGDAENPDHGADGYGRAFKGTSRDTRMAIVQVKYRSKKSGNLSENDFGNLRGLVANHLFENDEVNVTIVTNVIDNREPLDHEQSKSYIAAKFKNGFDAELQARIKIRVISGNQLERELNNFAIWGRIRRMSGMFN